MGKLVGILRGQAFGIAILVCAAVSFAFPAAFTSWGGVKLTKLVTPAIQVIMFGMGTTLTFADFVRVAALPANVFSIWMNFSGSILANWWNVMGTRQVPEE